MIRIPSDREPTHPGEMLREEFLIPMNISQRDLADAIHVPYQRVNELVNKKEALHQVLLCVWLNSLEYHPARTIHEYCCALAGSFIRNELFLSRP